MLPKGLQHRGKKMIAKGHVKHCIDVDTKVSCGRRSQDETLGQGASHTPIMAIMLRAPAKISM